MELYYDESSGYLLGAEIYNLDIGDIANLYDITDAAWSDTEYPDIGEVTIENLAGCYFLKRYAEYVGWPVKNKSAEWYPTSDTATSMRITKDTDTLNLTCSVYLDMDRFLNVKLNRN